MCVCVLHACVIVTGLPELFRICKTNDSRGFACVCVYECVCLCVWGWVVGWVCGCLFTCVNINPERASSPNSYYMISTVNGFILNKRTQTSLSSRDGCFDGRGVGHAGMRPCWAARKCFFFFFFFPTAEIEVRERGRFDFFRAGTLLLYGTNGRRAHHSQSP